MNRITGIIVIILSIIVFIQIFNRGISDIAKVWLILGAIIVFSIGVKLVISKDFREVRKHIKEIFGSLPF